MDDETILFTLEAARVNRGWNVEKAADRIGVHSDTLRKYEKDSTDVSRTFMLAVEDVYGIPLKHIFFGKKSEFFRIKETAS